jgi:hypothetical protein
MNLLNRYLQEVSKYLPKARREDIAAELRANITSQLEDREEELGRPLTDDEVVAMLQHHGNPMIVAGRYRPHNLGLAFGVQLIGPELFPFYRMILLLNLCITLVILAVVLPIVAREVPGAITLGRFLTPLLMQFAAVTVIFIALEKGKDHVLNRWHPGRLPPLKIPPDDGPSARNIFNFVAAAVGTVWLALTPRWPYLMLGPGALYLPAIPMKLMPEWVWFYWAIMALLCLELGLQFTNLLRLLTRRAAQVADLILKCAGLAIGILLLFKFPNYVTFPYPDVAEWANLSFLICVIVGVAIGLFGIVRALSRGLTIEATASAARRA